MGVYPVSIRRCKHIKVDGTQCGSPGLRDKTFCHFHERWDQDGMSHVVRYKKDEPVKLPALEDANSVQVWLAEVMRMLWLRQLDYKSAGLMLYALQTASSNMRRTSFEPEPTRVVIDRECVERRPIGASAWSAVPGREYDDLTEKKGDDAGTREAAVKEAFEHSATKVETVI